MTIGIFDSGVGGLTVWRQVRQALPQVPLLYVADQVHVPYGGRPGAVIRRFSRDIATFLINQGAETVVVACNTATAAAIEELRRLWPDIPFVGMEPAVKPAAAATRSGKIGVLATAGTFQSQRYADLLRRFAADLTVMESDCPGLVEQIEQGAFNTVETRQMLVSFLNPMLNSGADTVILGCTHYPLVLPLIEEIVGSGVTVINPAPAVARQTARLYRPIAGDTLSQLNPSTNKFWTTSAAGRPTLMHLVSGFSGEKLSPSIELLSLKAPAC